MEITASQKKRKFESTVVHLDVNGTKYTVEKSVILSKPETRLAKLVEMSKLSTVYVGRSSVIGDKEFFPLLLRYYHTGKFPLSQISSEHMDELYEELNHWQITLTPLFEQMKQKSLDYRSKFVVETFLDNFLASDILECYSSERYLNLFLQYYPESILSSFMPHKNGDVEFPKESYEDLETSIAEMSDDEEKGDNIFLLPKKPKMDFIEDVMRQNKVVKWKVRGKRYKRGELRKLSKHCKRIGNLHPWLQEIYFFFLKRDHEELRGALENIFPTELINICKEYLHTIKSSRYEFIEQHYLSYVLLFFHMVASGAEIFDFHGLAEEDEMIDIYSRKYALMYLETKGIKAEWKQMTIECEYKSTGEKCNNVYDFPSSAARSKNYKCADCSLSDWEGIYYKHRDHDHTHDSRVWYLHFRW